MKSYTLLAAAFALGLTLVSGDADAGKRFGGSKSFGMQRDASTPQKSNTNTTTQKADSTQPAAPAQAATQPKRSWMGPVAGLAAGLGLAALASHLGLGEEFANFLLLALLAMGALMAISYFMRRRGTADPSRATRLQYAAAGGETPPGRKVFDIVQPGSPGAMPATPATGRIPADFDVAGFERNAKVGFIRLQAANDAGDLEDIRAFTSPEVFAEIKMSIVERGQAPQQTDVVELRAELLEVVEEDGRYIASVHYSGLIVEDTGTAPAPFAEIWHVGRPLDGNSGWIVLGIQQVH